MSRVSPLEARAGAAGYRLARAVTEYVRTELNPMRLREKSVNALSNLELIDIATITLTN
jgi:hypothetical protein